VREYEKKEIFLKLERFMIVNYNDLRQIDQPLPCMDCLNLKENIEKIK